VEYKFEPEEVQLLVYQLLQKLSLLHKEGMYHGNLNFKSIMTRDIPTPDLFLSDFTHSGYSNSPGPAPPNSASLPPEALHSGIMGSQADIWAVGVVLSRLYN
jgi:serine/threonine protein kinase